MKTISLSNHCQKDLYKTMRRIRFFEEKIIEYYPEQEMRTPVHLCIGQEAIAAGVCYHLHDDDFIFSTHRNHGHCLAKGATYYQLLAEFYGKKTGCSGGTGGSMHPAILEKGILGTSAIVGGNIPIAVGAGWTNLLKNNDYVSTVFFGDGAAEEGTFHESLNFAAIKKIPVIFVCENNLYATASHISQRQPTTPTIADRAAGYGIPSCKIDGNDIFQVYKASLDAVMRAREGRGPTFIEALTYRWKSHVGPSDDTQSGHRPGQELLAWQKQCPIKKFNTLLKNNTVWNDLDEQELILHLEKEFSQALTQAKADPFPDDSDCFHHVYQE